MKNIVIVMGGIALIMALHNGLAHADERGPDDQAAVTGIWLTDGGQSAVELEVKNDHLSGSIVALAEPLTETGEIKTDRHNPDQALRSQPIIGLRILWGFRRDETGKWIKGRIYDPEEGKTYHAGITLDGDQLKLRGSLDRWGMLGRTTIWTRRENEP